MSNKIYRCQHEETCAILWLPYKPVGPYDCVEFMAVSDYDRDTQALREERDQLRAENARLREALLDSANSLEELAFAGELELSCQQGVVIRCACQSCMTDRAVKVLSDARKLAALAGKGGE